MLREDGEGVVVTLDGWWRLAPSGGLLNFPTFDWHLAPDAPHLPSYCCCSCRWYCCLCFCCCCARLAVVVVADNVANLDAGVASRWQNSNRFLHARVNYIGSHRHTDAAPRTHSHSLTLANIVCKYVFWMTQAEQEQQQQRPLYSKHNCRACVWVCMCVCECGQHTIGMRTRQEGATATTTAAAPAVKTTTRTRTTRRRRQRRSVYTLLFFYFLMRDPIFGVYTHCATIWMPPMVIGFWQHLTHCGTRGAFY